MTLSFEGGWDAERQTELSGTSLGNKKHRLIAADQGDPADFEDAHLIAADCTLVPLSYTLHSRSHSPLSQVDSASNAVLLAFQTQMKLIVENGIM